MTNKDAIFYLKQVREDYEGKEFVEGKEALDIAIKALEQPQGDCISRKALKNDILEKVCDKFDRCNKTITCDEFETFIRDVIDNAPTVDVTALCPVDFPTADDPYPCCSYKRPRGEWIVIHNALGETKYHCNQCQHYVKPSDDKNFCPNCGADMRGDNT